MEVFESGPSSTVNDTPRLNMRFHFSKLNQAFTDM